METLFEPSARYCLDTNVIIYVVLHMPPTRSTFEHIWTAIDAGIERGEIISHREAYEELMRGSHGEEIDWAKQNRHIFLDIDKQQDRAMHDFARRFPRCAGRDTSRINADPWIVLTAQLHKATVVTRERPARQHPQRDDQCSKIPDVCNALEIRWIDVQDFLEELTSGS